MISSIKDHSDDTSYSIDHYNSPEFASLQEELTIAREDVDLNANIFFCVAWTRTKKYCEILLDCWLHYHPRHWLFVFHTVTYMFTLYHIANTVTYCKYNYLTKQRYFFYSL